MGEDEEDGDDEEEGGYTDEEDEEDEEDDEEEDREIHETNTKKGASLTKKVVCENSEIFVYAFHIVYGTIIHGMNIMHYTISFFILDIKCKHSEHISLVQ
ncbi:hypothetical protein HPP92_006523 [Vanilla planifolia]|uniref:Uncharacterized protein n=1 Tax=Vanilla planifolia TaxID=51239 RepID=A0A835RK24_VANPL|nr:hypothetical protein HPP92_006523 [Vanilla planifolia]